MNLHKTNRSKAIITIMAGVMAGTMPLTAFSLPHQEKIFGLNAPFQIQDLPPGHVVSKLESLPNTAKQKALEWMHRISFAEKDLEFMQIDNKGGVLYADTFLPDENLAATLPGIEQLQAIAPGDAFTLHSKPGSAKVIYLDFNGHTITRTAWNTLDGIPPVLNAKAFTTDSDYANFSPTELSQIAEMWNRVAEDYAPFDIDVTTEEPAVFGPKVARLLITENVDTNGKQMPFPATGGVAYLGVWDMFEFASQYSPAIVYYNNLSSYPPYIAEAAAHEIGHNLGLSHDGTASQTYYTGHGSGFVSWAPIMGMAYYQNITQWSIGEYPLANQKQDDLYLISSRLKYRPDQVGNNISTASPLLADSAGTITATNPETDPHNENPNNKGIIETGVDIDYFSFDTGAGLINIIYLLHGRLFTGHQTEALIWIFRPCCLTSLAFKLGRPKLIHWTKLMPPFLSLFLRATITSQ